MKNIFSYNADYQKNAYINWRMNYQPDNIQNNFNILASGYSRAIKELLNLILQENRDKKADVLIFPILFSINHVIELYIKSIIIQFKILNGETTECKLTHDIHKLYIEMIELINKKEHDAIGLEKHLESLKQYIAELYEKIQEADDDKEGKAKPKLDFARYPMDSAWEIQFYLRTRENIVVDVENLLKRFEEIEDSLESLFLKYEAEIDSKKEEARSEAEESEGKSCHV